MKDTQNTTLKKKPRREDVTDLNTLCDYCSGKCCRYFAMEIDEPVDWEDFDRLRWFVLHEYSTLFTEDDHWFLLIQTRCRKLDENNRCTDYENRPNVCREYTTAHCEYEDHWVYDRYFETPEQVAEYAEALLGPRNGDEIRTPQY